MQKLTKFSRISSDSFQILSKIEKKTKLAVQFVSHCGVKSDRETLSRKLQKYINITNFGECFGRRCPGDECLERNIDEHFFYLAFENSICKQYVTEKFWRIKRLVVPVVLSRMVLEGFDIPPDSFIAVDDFQSIEDLAKHLVYLRNNQKEYLKYFEWTKIYKKSNAIMDPLCDLCKLVIQKPRRRIENIVDWWDDSPRGKCVLKSW
ncbi:glycosyltransferase family 10 (fucosyltransferase) c-term domain-containing protein [Ditylenchus destructor]|nr:glycosyltransferase family 10 (fucosyltransferase) c-term domain-containing protein [Ditylenchus destructor]